MVFWCTTLLSCTNFITMLSLSNCASFVVTLQLMLSVASHVIRSSSHPHVSSTLEPTKVKKTEYCWESERFSSISECVPCSKSELMQEAVCKETGNKQLVQCEKSNQKSYTSCPLAISFERRRFWTFEAVSLAGAILSNIFVWWRRRVLNTFHYQRVKRQMSSATV